MSNNKGRIRGKNLDSVFIVYFNYKLRVGYL